MDIERILAVIRPYISDLVEDDFLRKMLAAETTWFDDNAVFVGSRVFLHRRELRQALTGEEYTFLQEKVELLQYPFATREAALARVRGYHPHDGLLESG